MEDSDAPPTFSWALEDVLSFMEECPHYGAYASVGSGDTWLEVSVIREATSTLKFLHDGRIEAVRKDSYGKVASTENVGNDPEVWWEHLGVTRVRRDKT